MASLVIESVGWLGAGLVITAYFLLTQKRVSGDAKVYHLLNLVGGAGIIVNSLSNSAYPPAALNIVWSLIAISGVIKSRGQSRAG